MVFSFEFWWWSLVVVTLVLTVVNGMFLSKLRLHDRALVERLGSPSAMFFATGGWLTSHRFPSFLLSATCRETLAHSPTLFRLGRATAALFVASLICLLAGMLTAFLHWGAK